jgi:Na+/proline symporter
MSAVFFGVMAYVALQFAVGVWASRRIATLGDYVNAGRSLGSILVAFSVFATWFGAEAIVATAGSVHEGGLAGALIDPIGYALGIVAAALLLARPLWSRGFATFADLFRQRYSAGVEKLVVLVLLPGSVFWAAAQIRAFGQVMSASSGLDATTTILAAVVVVVVYSAIGGLLADAWSDLVQGLAIVIGLVVLAGVVAAKLGGVGAAIGKIEAERLVLLTAGEGGWLSRLESIAIAVCGTVVAVELISRMLGARSAKIAVNGALAGGLLYLVVGMIPVFLGLVGGQLVDKVEDAEHLIPKLAEANLSTLLYVMFAGAVISAILSTVDTALLAQAAQVSRNLIEPLRTARDEATRILATRVVLVLLALVAVGLALTADKVKSLVETASAAGSAGVFVTAMFALFTRFGGSPSAYAAMIAGAGVWVVGSALDLALPYLSALLASLVGYVAAALALGRSK